jgi:CubicO group peptidase (beta-lactamase class C family)
MPVASNTKAMVAAAMYRLQQQGLLNVSASAADFLDPKDFPERKGGCLGVCARGVRE